MKNLLLGLIVGIIVGGLLSEHANRMETNKPKIEKEEGFVSNHRILFEVDDFDCLCFYNEINVACLCNNGKVKFTPSWSLEGNEEVNGKYLEYEVRKLLI